jgi:hypothetical protein
MNLIAVLSAEFRRLEEEVQRSDARKSWGPGTYRNFFIPEAPVP